MSSYLVLARKYRPTTFDEVVGQESVTSILRGAIEEGRLGHAYLFAGPRGTGKTTTARILAKCLNCEQGPTATPCGTCDRCVGADEGSEVDIIEIDAASHNGVDTIRELRDEVAYAPMRARHKVYIVDEVHMLSKPAFNALLKTLEEPPAHVVFLFATTEPHKVIDTVLSRCQVMRLSALSEERIEARLDEVFRREGVEAQAGVTRELARAARGGMRDALSMADKLLALAADKPTLADLERLGGDGGSRRLGELLQAVEQADRRSLIEILESIGEDEEELAAGILDLLRMSVVAHHCGSDAPFLSATEEERTAAAERAKRLGAARLELWMQELLRARERMRLLPDQARLVLETTLLDLARPETTIPLADLLTRLEALESGAGSVPATRPAGGAPAPRAPAAPSTRVAPRAAGPAPAAQGSSPADPRPRAATPAPPVAKAPAPSSHPPSGTPGSGGSLAECFEPFLETLGKTHDALAQLLAEHGSSAALEEGPSGVASLRLGGLSDKERKITTGARNLAACGRAFSEAAGRPIEFRILTGGAGSANQPSAKAGPKSAQGELRPARGASPGPTAAGSAPAEQPASSSPRRAPADGSGKKASPGGTDDLFTQKVADTFDGPVEELQ